MACAYSPAATAEPSSAEITPRYASIVVGSVSKAMNSVMYTGMACARVGVFGLVGKIGPACQPRAAALMEVAMPSMDGKGN